MMGCGWRSRNNGDAGAIWIWVLQIVLTRTGQRWIGGANGRVCRRCARAGSLVGRSPVRWDGVRLLRVAGTVDCPFPPSCGSSRFCRLLEQAVFPFQSFVGGRGLRIRVVRHDRGGQSVAPCRGWAYAVLRDWNTRFDWCRARGSYPPTPRPTHPWVPAKTRNRHGFGRSSSNLGRFDGSAFASRAAPGFQCFPDWQRVGL